MRTDETAAARQKRRRERRIAAGGVQMAVEIPAETLARAREAARAQGVTLQKFIVAALLQR